MDEEKKAGPAPALGEASAKAAQDLILSLLLALMTPLAGCWVGAVCFADEAKGILQADALAAPFLLGVINLFNGVWGWMFDLGGLLMLYCLMTSNPWRLKFLWAFLWFGLIVGNVWYLQKII